MNNFSSMSDEDLMKVAGISDISDSELMQIAGLKTTPPHPENILQRAAKAITQISPQQTGYEVAGGTGPMDLGLSMGSRMMGGPNMLNSSAKAEGMRTQGLEGIKNPFLKFAANLATDPMTYAGGGVAAKSVAGSGAGKAVGNVLTKSSRLKYLDKMEGAVYSARGKAAPAFKEGIDRISAANPGKGVDLTEFVNKYLNSADESVQRAINNSPEIQEILTHPGGGAGIPLMEAQKALNSLTTKLPKNVLAGAGKRSGHIPIMDMVDDLKMTMSRDFPELQSVRSEYGKLLENFKSVRPKVSGDAGEKNLFTNINPFQPSGHKFMGGERGQEKFRSLIGEDLYKEAKNTRLAKGSLDAAKAGGGAYLAKRVVETLFGKKK